MLDIGLVQTIVGRSLEFLIGRNPFSGEVTDAQKAAYDIFIELENSCAVKLDPNDGRSIVALLKALDAHDQALDKILLTYGLAASTNHKDGNLSATTVALRIRETIQTQVNKWATKAGEQGHEDHPDWDERANCLSDLKSMRIEVGAYLDTLVGIARSPRLSDRIPRPDRKVVAPTKLSEPASISNHDDPKRSMVRWLDPIEGARIALSGRGADKDPNAGRQVVYAKTNLVGSDPNKEPNGDLWIDYVSDLGDAFDPTMAVAWQLSAPHIELPSDRAGDLPHPPSKLPRGSLLVMGGDEIYPYASAKGYKNQLELPYRLAGDHGIGAEAGVETEAGAQSPEQKPTVVAIPGNHDWLGGIEHFDKVFVQADTFATHWHAPQKQRWWVVELQAGWWMWGIDTGLHDTLDDAQFEFFEAAAQDLDENDRVIFCTPVPLWQLLQKREAKYDELHPRLTGLIKARGATAPLFLAGDSHYFAQYERVDGQDSELHITAGGGGAFLQPTHNLDQQVPSQGDDPVFKLGARWPRPIDSRNLATNVAMLRDQQFRRLFVALALPHLAFAALASIGFTSTSAGQGFIDRAVATGREVLSAWPGWPLLLGLILAATAATVPNSKERDLVAGARKYGFIHGVAQAATLVAVAVLARLVGPDASWWRLLVVPLLGGVFSAVVLVAFTKWINKEIKANDTLAYSSAHLTRYKNFIRMSISTDGDLRLYVVGIDPVGDGWFEALKSGASIPPGGSSKLHYVWGWDSEVGSTQQLHAHERDLGKDNDTTIRIREQRIKVLMREHQSADAVALAQENLEICETKKGQNDPETAERREVLAQAQLLNGDISEAIGHLHQVLAVRLDPTSQPADAAQASQATAATRCRLVSALSEPGEGEPGNGQAAGEPLREWVTTQPATKSDDWRTTLDEILEADATTLAKVDRPTYRQCLLLRSYHATATVAATETDTSGATGPVAKQIEKCQTQLGTDHAVTRFGRRLLAGRLQSGDRTKAIQVLERNGIDRLSLRGRRELATKLLQDGVAQSSTAERDSGLAGLQKLVADTREYSTRDSSLVDAFLVPTWMQLAKTLGAGDPASDSEKNELTECYEYTKSPEVLQKLNDVRIPAGLGAYGTPANGPERDTKQVIHTESTTNIYNISDPDKGDKKSSTRPALAAAGAAVAVAAAIIGGVFVISQSLGPTSEPVTEILGASVTATAPSPTVDPVVEPNPLGAPAVVSLPPSLGRNIVVLPLEASDARSAEATIFSDVLAESLGVGAQRWKVWGPGELEADGVSVIELAAMLGSGSDDSGYNELDIYLADRNIDVAIFGSLTGSAPNSVITLDVWFRSSTNGLAEAGIAGQVQLWTNKPDGSTRGVDRIAEGLPQGEAPLVPLLQGFSAFKDAAEADDFRAAREYFVQVKDGVADQDSVRFGLHDLATLFIGSSESFIATTIPGSNAARYDALSEAEATYSEATRSDSLEVQTRALMGLAQTQLLASACVGGRFDTINAAQKRFNQARAASLDVSPGPHEIVLRLDMMESTIAFCRWLDGASADPALGDTAVDDSALADTALGAMNRVADSYLRRPPEEQDRLVFNAAEIFGQRAILRLEISGDDATALAKVVQDFAYASCWAREFRRDVWQSRLDELGFSDNCEDNDRGPFAEPLDTE